MGDGVMGGGCYGGWSCERRVLWGMVLWEEGVMGDGVVRGGCYGGWCCGRRVLWGMVLWEEGVMGDPWCWGDGVMDNTSEPTNIFRSDFWGLFSL